MFITVSYATAVPTIVNSWNGLQEAIKTNGAVIELGGNIVAGAEDTELFIPSGVSIELDLKGYTINRNLSEAVEHGHVFHIEGNMILKDSGTTGKITGGKATGGESAGCGGGICINGGSVTMLGGTITENTASFGGGVCAAAFNSSPSSTFRMKGGTISYNSALMGEFFVSSKGYIWYTTYSLGRKVQYEPYNKKRKGFESTYKHRRNIRY